MARASTSAPQTDGSTPPAAQGETARAIGWGLATTLLLAALIAVGSRNLEHFDAALVAYTSAVLFATFGLTYRYTMWLQRPPTAVYWRRGWQAFFRKGFRVRNARVWVQRMVTEVAANRFILRRNRLRGVTHLLIMWGCLLAVAITFPLVFGWLYFRPVPDQLDWYRIVVFGFPTVSFPVGSALAFFIFHGLVWASFLVIAGVMLAMRRRMREEGRRRRAALRRGLPSPHPALRGQPHRADAHRQLHVDEGLRVQLHRHPARGDGHRHLPLAPVREVLPHLPAPGPARRRLLQGRGPRRRGRALPPLRPRVHVEDARRGPHRGRARAGLPLRGGRAGGALPVDLPPLPARLPLRGPGHAVAGTARGRAPARRSPAAPCPCPPTPTRAWAKAPWAPKTPRTSTRERRPRDHGIHQDRRRARDRSPPGRDHRALRAAPGLLEGHAPGHRRGAGPDREDALLLLRPAVRHSAPREGRGGHRLRALVRLPLQQGQALPQGHQAIPAGEPPRPAAPRLPEGRRRARRLPGDAVRGGHPAGRRRDRAHPVGARTRRVRHAVRREPHHREDVPDGQVRPHGAQDGQHRLQRPPVHGERRRGQQEGLRHRPGGQSLERHPGRRGGLDQRRQRRRVRAHHHGLRVAGPGARARRSSSWIRA